MFRSGAWLLLYRTGSDSYRTKKSSIYKIGPLRLLLYRRDVFSIHEAKLFESAANCEESSYSSMYRPLESASLVDALAVDAVTADLFQGRYIM